jgi:hypothetical protein
VARAKPDGRKGDKTAARRRTRPPPSLVLRVGKSDAGKRIASLSLRRYGSRRRDLEQLVGLREMRSIAEAKKWAERVSSESGVAQIDVDVA